MNFSSFPSEADWHHFLTQGGQQRFEIDATDIDSTRGFERVPALLPLLDTGFTLAPSSSLFDSANTVLLARYGGGWVSVIYQIYHCGGIITYKRLNADLYEAVCTLPSCP